MPNSSAGPVQGGIDDAPHLPRRIGSANRCHLVLGVDGSQKRTDNGPEQSQWQAMTDKIQHDEAAARAGHVLDQPDEIGLRKMVDHTDRDRNIRRWEGIGHRIAGEYWYRCVGGGQTQVDSDDLRAKLPANLVKENAVTAAYVEHAANRDWILTQKT